VRWRTLKVSCLCDNRRGDPHRPVEVIRVVAHFYWLVIGVLAVWRITHLFYGEEGPGDIFVRLRRAAGRGFWGALLDCFYCLSVWVALPFAYWLGESWKQRVMLWPALSAGAILLERLTSREPLSRELHYTEFEDDDELLRQEEKPVQDSHSRRRS
jgi:hypothetical protein